MNDEIDLSPSAPDRIECGIERRRIRHIAGEHHLRADTRGKWLNTFPKRLPLIRESQLGTFSGAGLRNSPGDRAVIGDTHDEPLRARQ